MTKSDELDDTMRVLSTGTCDTLSGLQQTDLPHRLRAGRRNLPARAQQHRRRILLAGMDLAAGHPDGTEETSGGEAHHVHPAESPLRGKSANTPGFMMAVLLHEKVVRSMQGKLRRHELVDPSVFTEKVEKLMASGTNVKASLQSLEATPPRKPPSRRKHQHPRQESQVSLRESLSPLQQKDHT